MKILVEGIGSMVFGTQIKYYRELGWEIVGIDITGYSFGVYQVDKAYLVPKYSEDDCWIKIEEIIEKEEIDLVFPTVNEGLISWSRNKKKYKELYDTDVIISDENVIDVCVDKWKTFCFFKQIGVPTPETSLELEYEFLKPRIGRGSTGICLKSEIKTSQSKMQGYISQEMVTGEEYTIDVLCDFNSNPIYIIPRKRLETESGVSVKGVTVYDGDMLELVETIIEKLKPIGVINIQCFKNRQEIKFIEINPRLAGGSSLSFAASDNWFKAIACFYKKKNYYKKDIIYDKYMFRYFNDIIISNDQLLKKGEL
jgi:carbamoyl-phosphate synthase large subunit